MGISLPQLFSYTFYMGTPGAKALRRLYFIPLLPLFLLTIDSVFTDFFYMTLTGAKTLRAAYLVATYNYYSEFSPDLFDTLVMLTAFGLWFYPIWAFAKTGSDKFRSSAKERLSGLYKYLSGFFIGYLFLRIAMHLYIFRHVLVPGIFWQYNFPALIISVSVQLYLALVVFDNVVFGQADALMDSLYGSKALYRLHSGYDLSLVKKIFLLIFSTSIVPMLLIYIFITKTTHLSSDQMNVLYSFITIAAFTPMVLEFTFIFTHIQRPINNLIRRMKRLADGDYNVKSKIYFSDEIAQLKDGFNVMVDQLREREELRATFGKYVSIEVAKKLLESGALDLGGHEIEASVMFCDIRNFTALSERATPAEVVELLNNYFAHITMPITENHGVINKFLGDAVMAIYAPGLGSQKHADDALRSALGMRKALEAFNQSRPGKEPLKFGIGIHSGVLVAGNIGTSTRLEYTVIGDTVNVASRIEAATKEAHSDLLITKATHDRLGPELLSLAEFKPVGPVTLRGKQKQIEIYKVS